MKTITKTAWETSSSWYDRTVGEKGHYYHQQVILPNLLRLLDLSPSSSLLDLACGQGILSRHLPKQVLYTGLDASPSLIQTAKRYQPPAHHQFLTADVTAPLPLSKKDYTHATLILALQNIEDAAAVLRNASAHLISGGLLAIVLNHPCFRIPRQSHWQIDPSQKTQYRRIDRYFTPLKIPIHTHPSQDAHSPTTYSFHRPLSAYSTHLKEAGFHLLLIEEWLSDKTSTGKNASMENRSRAEFPLFLTLLAQKE